MLQKALKDKVLTNKCVMDSILWFHIECPRSVAAFDDPDEFKLKWRGFFALQKSFQEHKTDTEEAKKVEMEFDHISYPEDVKERKELHQFREDFKEFDPILYPESADDWDTEILQEDKDTETAIRDRAYNKPTKIMEIYDLKAEDSAKFSKNL